MSFKVYAGIDLRLLPSQVAAAAQRIEALGFDGMNVPDGVRDGLLTATLALNATRKINVATSVLVAFPRSPMTVAQACWDLQALSQGRFELGLGTQIKQNIEERYSAVWQKPLTQMREYVLSLRAIFNSFQTGAPLHFDGEYYHFKRLQAFFNPGPFACSGNKSYPPPLYLGAIGDKMMALAAEVGDGLMAHPTNTSPLYVEKKIRPQLQVGAQKAGKNISEVKLMLATQVAVGLTEEAVVKQREKQRELIAFLYSTPAYWPSLELFGLQQGEEGLGRQLQLLTRENKWQDMVGLINDDLLDKVIVSGCYDEIAAKLKQHYGDVSDWITFPVPENPEEDEATASVIKELQR
jgi:probable F420-dependent oxidoreductase